MKLTKEEKYQLARKRSDALAKAPVSASQKEAIKVIHTKYSFHFKAMCEELAQLQADLDQCHKDIKKYIDAADARHPGYILNFCSQKTYHSGNMKAGQLEVSLVRDNFTQSLEKLEELLLSAKLSQEKGAIAAAIAKFIKGE